MAKQVRTWFNPIPSKAEYTDPVSRTQADQTMTMRTMFARYAQGLPLNGVNSDMAYDKPDAPEMPDYRTLDLVDIQHIKEQNQAEIARLKQKASSEAKQAEEAKIEAKIAEQKAAAEKAAAEKSTNLP